MSLDAGNIHHWESNESSGLLSDTGLAKTIDSDITIVGATFGVPGVISTALSYNGTNNDGSDGGVGTDIAQGSADFTIIPWTKDSNPSGQDGIFCAKQSGAGAQGFVMNRGTNGTLEVFVVTSTGTHVISALGSSLNNGSFHQLGIQRVGSTLYAIIDGVRAGSVAVSGTISNASEPFRLGRRGSGNFYQGVIDDIGVWNRALSVSEIAQHYNAGAGLPQSGYTAATPSGILRFRISTTGQRFQLQE